MIFLRTMQRIFHTAEDQPAYGLVPCVSAQNRCVPFVFYYSPDVSGTLLLMTFSFFNRCTRFSYSFVQFPSFKREDILS